MGIHYTFRGDLIIVSAHGFSSYEEVAGVFDKIASDPMFKPPAKILFDARQTNYGPSTEELETLACHLAAIDAFLEGRWAIVTRPTSMLHGLARVFCAHAESNGLIAEPFPQFIQACCWLLNPEISCPSKITPLVDP